MKDINYKIEIHSPWHCGSGLSKGSDVDSLVIKDDKGLPFIPGKTLKGLIREAVEDYVSLTTACDEEDVVRVFGRSGTEDFYQICKGMAFFTNAELSEEEKDPILSDNLQPFMFDKVSSTAIDENGVADDHSLRRYEVVIPCTLYASICFVDDNFVPILSKALGMVKRLGVNRNRGLGRCTISVINK